MGAFSSPATFEQLPVAGTFPRLAAMVYDAMILAGLWVVYGFLAMPLTSLLGGLECNPSELDYNPCVRGPLFQLGLLVVTIGYFFWSWRSAGQTIGMRAWRLLLATPDGAQLSWRQCALRALVAPVSLGLAGIGYFWAWSRTDRACWHDLASASEVRVLPKRRDS